MTVIAARLSRVCLEESIRYALKRKAFGKPLAETQVFVVGGGVIGVVVVGGGGVGIDVVVIVDIVVVTLFSNLNFIWKNQAIRMKIAAMARRIECLYSWLESLTYQMCTMEHDEANLKIGDVMCLCKVCLCACGCGCRCVSVSICQIGCVYFSYPHFFALFFFSLTLPPRPKVQKCTNFAQEKPP